MGNRARVAEASSRLGHAIGLASGKRQAKHDPMGTIEKKGTQRMSMKIGIRAWIDFAFRKIFGKAGNEMCLIGLLNSVLQQCSPNPSFYVGRCTKSIPKTALARTRGKDHKLHLSPRIQFVEPRVAGVRCPFCHQLSKRRARGSNPQPLTGHFISNEAASHSPTLQTNVVQEHILAVPLGKPIRPLFLGFYPHEL